MAGTRLETTLGKFHAQMAPLFEEGEFDLAKRTIIEGCRAIRRVRAGKDPETGAYKYEDIPDYPVRLVSAKVVLEYVVGKPIQRSITANLTPGKDQQTQEEFFQEALADPESAQSLVETLHKMIDAAQKAKSVEVNVTPTLTEGEKPTS